MALQSARAQTPQVSGFVLLRTIQVQLTDKLLRVSETEYSHQAIADIAPLRDLFASLFFISVGLMVDLRFAAAHLPTILGLAVAVVVVKSLVAGGAVAVVGLPARVRILVGFSLAQVGSSPSS